MHCDGDSSVESEVRRLTKQIRQLKRRIRQAERQAATSEAISAQSKRSMLRTNEELHSTNEKLRDAKVQADAASAAKGHFVATVSHEMRTPLNGILGSIELLRTFVLDDEATEIVSLMHRSTVSLLQIINDILDVSKVESGRLELECLPFSLEECVRGVVDLQRQAARQKGVSLHCVVDPELPNMVVGDSTRLRQVLLNLTDNAVKFTRCGKVEVLARSSGRTDCIAICIADEGIGIEPVALEHIFEAFTQEDSSTTRRFGGTGLGLAICKGLVKLMGSELQVISTPRVGTTFVMSPCLPAAPDLDADVAVKSKILQLPQFQLHVLVVDDTETNLVIAQKMLAKLGCSSEVVRDGQQAVDRVIAKDFDAVLMDCSMPVLDGFSSTRMIRALGTKKSKVPILAMTAYAGAEDRERCIAAGMSGHVAKPVRLHELSAALLSVGLEAVSPMPPG